MPKMAQEPLVETDSYLLIAQYVSTSYLTQDSKIPDSKISVFFIPLFNKIYLSAFKALSTPMLCQKYAFYFSLSPKKHRSIDHFTVVDLVP